MFNRDGQLHLPAPRLRILLAQRYRGHTYGPRHMVYQSGIRRVYIYRRCEYESHEVSLVWHPKLWYLTRFWNVESHPVLHLTSGQAKRSTVQPRRRGRRAHPLFHSSATP